ncbi:MAG: biotin--[acetyl-CoA-carboxylase] ligase [Desulfobacterales bacterium]|uniref:Bifunctional ligase/repressor BirA n=1 Tax=Candidatus Desulfaltia bathyphila TaxID=2841697 RepID=A0A8J6N5D4_9BACT|nr:biotin--[acetyl-CoA-carboxylase] ligase [Candidatus Desulfaltia bathyphila]MBL7194962.1 biotin--[acetyl-CoA-carboxylase] ligase [Desulfobacterales bacterium]MBL7207485.1 biotin--[acetyl-CoA-carboxylase] ligase [Desulfobacterales bacterium]
MKGQILKIFKREKRIVSGEALSSELGVSRVSIWKHVRKLQELGYNIIATTTGYRLIDSIDALFPWEFPDRESKIHFFPKVTSTMDVAGEFARKGCSHFTVIIAGCQKKGRGRLKRIWHSSEGGLYFTIVLRPQIPPVLSLRLNFAASLVLAQLLRQMFCIDAMVKWPNDILVNNRKISGMLSEIEAESDMVSFLNIGFGINVNNDPAAKEPAATSLRCILGKKISRKQLLSEFLDKFESYINNVNLDNVIPEWKKYTITLNRRVKVVTSHDISEGVAIDVDENGTLILELADGSIKKVIYGDCFHI